MSDDQWAPGGNAAIEDVLDRLGREQRATLQAAEHEQVEPGAAEANFRELLELEFAERKTSGAPRGPLLRWFAAAAALLLLTTWLTWPDAHDRPVSHELTLGAELRVLRPVGKLNDFMVFEFEPPTTWGANAWAEFVVYDASHDAAPILESGRVRATFWSPAAPIEASVERIRWQVQIWTGGAVPQLVAGSREVTATR